MKNPGGPFFVGCSIMQGTPRLEIYLFQTLMFALASPFGAAIAQITPISVAPAMLGLSSGTFLYVGTIELVAKHIVRPQRGQHMDSFGQRMENVGFFVVGWAMMSLLAMWL